MSAVSSLEISNWNEEIFMVDISKPELVDYFTVNYNLSKLSNDINSLKYFDAKAKLNVFKMKTKFHDNMVSKDLTVNDEVLLPFKQWVENNCSKKYFEEVEIVTFPSVLSTIMNTPFEISGDKKKWKINVTLKGNKIFLIPINAQNYNDNSDIGKDESASFDNGDTDFFFELCKKNIHNCLCETRVSNSASNVQPDAPKLLKHYELLKRYLFVRKPEKLHRKVLSVWDKLFYEIYQLNIGDNKVLYLSETPGVLSEQKLDSVETLKTAEHIYCDVTQVGEITQQVINYNPVWWSRAHLINAKQCIIGIYNEQKEDLQEIINFKTDKFDDIIKYENIWSPSASWNFLDDVLSFIKDEVYRIDPEFRCACSWEFSSYENDRPYVTVIPYGPHKSAIANNCIN